jgi:hypothetical protein
MSAFSPSYIFADQAHLPTHGGADCERMPTFAVSSLPALVVLRLFRTSSPATIARFIVSLVINAINGVFRGWRVTHVAVKRIKGIEPLFAHRDRSIVAMSLVLSVANTILSILPRSPDFRAPFTMGDIPFHNGGIIP